MADARLAWLSATELAALIRRKKVWSDGVMGERQGRGRPATRRVTDG